MSKSTGLSSGDRLLLSLGSVAMLLVMSAMGCAALAVEGDVRALVSISAAVVGALCVSVLLQDTLDTFLRATVRHVGRWIALSLPKEQAI